MDEIAFLDGLGWGAATATPLAGDASGRRYTRLAKGSDTAILMDAGPDSAPALNRFADIAQHLSSLGLSAPDILGADGDRFLLLEDLGDAIFARVIDQDPSQERKLYRAAIDALIVCQNGPIPAGIDAYGPAEMLPAINLAFEWYPTPQSQYPAPQVAEFKTALKAALDEHLTGQPVMIQRDFHAENLIWLPDRTGPTRVGLLDFQDAVYGHKAYDLASLLVDARRDVSPALRSEMIAYYCAETQTDQAPFETAFALCSAQRNLRILGIFSRLAIRDGKSGYIGLIPRVWRNLMTDLSHDGLDQVARLLRALLPEPGDQVLAQIRGAHG